MILASVEDVIFKVADALRVPVLVLALAALAFVVVELGAFAVEVARRRRRDSRRLETAADAARSALEKDNAPAAYAAVQHVAWSSSMATVLSFLVSEWGQPRRDDRVNKALADFDFGSLRRLERTRILVRVGPALGLMGTLIPLSPALAGLASGDVKQLSDNLRVAFSITVLGLLIGGIAFAISLVRDRLYGQDLSDLQYMAASLGEGNLK